MRGQHQRQAQCCNRQGAPNRRPRSEPRDGIAGKKRRDDGGQEDKIHKSQIHSPQRKRRTDEDEVHEGEGPDKGEQDAEADPEGGAQCRIAPVRDQRCERRLRRRH